MLCAIKDFVTPVKLCDLILLSSAGKNRITNYNRFFAFYSDFKIGIKSMFYLKTCAMFPFEYFLAINIRFFLLNKGKDFPYFPANGWLTPEVFCSMKP